MNKSVCVGAVSMFLASGCGGGNAESATTAAGPPKPPPICAQAKLEPHAVLPFKNSTGAKLEVGGAHELLSAAMQDSGCFRLVERERVEILLSEMKLCADTNPDKEYFKCDSFAQKGKVLGVKRFVFPEVVFFEPNVKGAELAVKIPGLSGVGVEAGRSYAAMSVSVRVVDAESGVQTANTVEHLLLASDKLGGGVSTHGVDLRAMVYDKTPFGVELDGTFHKLSKKLGAP